MVLIKQKASPWPTYPNITCRNRSFRAWSKAIFFSCLSEKNTPCVRLPYAYVHISIWILALCESLLLVLGQLQVWLSVWSLELLQKKEALANCSCGISIDRSHMSFLCWHCCVSYPRIKEWSSLVKWWFLEQCRGGSTRMPPKIAG